MWPENAKAFTLFTELQTQWNVGPSGHPTGLRYESLYPRLDRLTKTDDEWQELFDDIRVLENSALKVLTREK